MAKTTSRERLKQEVTDVNLLKFRSHAFAAFATGSNGDGHFQIGVNGFGKYEVRYPNGEELTFEFAADAVNAFQKLLQ